tara:strand:- start:10360 stop:11013 length:654 start_codon:yes stop_codon:yes gene_type:complete
MLTILSLFFFTGCSDHKPRYDQHVERYVPHIVDVHEVNINIPVGDDTYRVPVKFNMSKDTVTEDIRHVAISSQRFLEKLDRRKRHECYSRIESIEVYHVPCAAMNDDELQDWIKNDYVVKDSNVIIGLTAEKAGARNDRSTFAVGYCFDEMVKKSTQISYSDSYWRELALAHEMSHVWFLACEPIDAWWNPEKYEEMAWEFHEEYESTAKSMHVDYK